MDFMTCNTCRRVVKVNNTGVCLGCQRGFTKEELEDYKEAKVASLEARQQELEQSLQKLDEDKEHGKKRRRRKTKTAE